jgi:uncharacterized protein YaaR (DUF327 family)
MSKIDPVSDQSLYFAAARAALDKTSEEIRKKKKTQSKTGSFLSSLSKSKETAELAAEGFPPEIAGLSEEDAVIFLKDAVDVAGDELSATLSPAAFSNYRKKIGQFMRYVERNSFEIVRHRRRGFTKKGRPRDPAIQIQVINKTLDELASDLLYNHLDKLKMLSRVNEINGLIIDLLAS